MPVRIALPLTKRFHFVVEPGEIPGQSVLRACQPDKAEGFVEFRQATNGDNERRGQLFAERRFSLDENGKIAETTAFNPAMIAREEVFLTINDTDIELPDGSQLEFENVGSVRRPKPASFRKWWDALPLPWAEQLYRWCVEVNPDWGFKSWAF